MTKSQRKKARQEENARRKKRKTALIATICIVVIAAVIVFLVLAQSQNKPRVFENGRQTITLNSDGTFAARLAHSVNYDGIYAETKEGNTTTVSFTWQGITANGRLLNDVLTIPHEWDDGHGHGNTFRLR